MNLSQVLQAPEVAPTTGSQGRVQVTQVNPLGAIKSGMDLIAQKMQKDYVIGSNQFLSQYVQEEQKAVESFILGSGEQSQVDQTLNAIQQSGYPMDDGMRASLQGAVDMRNKLQLMREQGKGEAAVALIRRKFLSNAIAQRPDLAKDIIALTNAQNSLTDKATDVLKLQETDKFAVYQKQVKMRSEELIKRGYDIEGQTPEQINATFEEKVGNRIRLLAESEERLRQIDADTKITEGERKKLRNDVYFDSIDTIVGNVGSAMSDILNSTDSPEQKVLRIEAVRAQIQQGLATQFKGATSQEIQDKFGMVFDMLKTANELTAGKVDEATSKRLQAQLQTMQTVAGIETFKNYGPLAKEITGIQNGLGIKLSEFVTDAQKRTLLLPFQRSLFENVGNAQTGKQPVSGLDSLGPRPTSQQASRIGQATAEGLTALSKAKELTPVEIDAAAGTVLSFVKNPYNSKSLDAFNNLLPALADPNVTKLLRSEKYGPELQKAGTEVLGRYMSTMIASVEREVADTKATLALSAEGLPVFEGQIRDTKLLAVQNKLQQTVKAYAHLRGVDYLTATREMAGK